VCDRLPNWLYFCFLLAGIEGRLSAVSTMRKTGECTINREQLDEICPSAPVGGLRIAQLCLRKSSDEVGRKNRTAAVCPRLAAEHDVVKHYFPPELAWTTQENTQSRPRKSRRGDGGHKSENAYPRDNPVRNRSDEIGPQVAEEVSAKNSCSASCVAVR